MRSAFQDYHFDRCVIRLDGNSFYNCTFENCVIEFAAAEGFDAVNCTFSACEIRFVDSAALMVEFIRLFGESRGFDKQMFVEMFGLEPAVLKSDDLVAITEFLSKNKKKDVS